MLLIDIDLLGYCIIIDLWHRSLTSLCSIVSQSLCGIYAKKVNCLWLIYAIMTSIKWNVSTQLESFSKTKRMKMHSYVTGLIMTAVIHSVSVRYWSTYAVLQPVCHFERLGPTHPPHLTSLSRVSVDKSHFLILGIYWWSSAVLFTTTTTLDVELVRVNWLKLKSKALRNKTSHNSKCLKTNCARFQPIIIKMTQLDFSSNVTIVR